MFFCLREVVTGGASTNPVPSCLLLGLFHLSTYLILDAQLPRNGKEHRDTGNSPVPYPQRGAMGDCPGPHIPRRRVCLEALQDGAVDNRVGEGSPGDVTSGHALALPTSCLWL